MLYCLLYPKSRQHVLCVNYFIVSDPYLPPVVCFWGKVSSTTYGGESG